MNLSAGIVGLPNVGKSTLFNSLSSGEVDSENYPFCTIEPNVAMVPVPDSRVAEIADYFEPEETTPASVEVHDIAGLVEGAADGEGLGNEFLDNIAATDALVHVVRCFESDDIAHVDGSVDPVRDVETIETELILKDLQTMELRLEKAEKAAKGGEKDDELRLTALEEIQALLDDGRPAREADLSERQATLIREEPIVSNVGLLTMKPVLYVGNVGEREMLRENDSEHVAALREEAERRGGRFLTVCADLEAELAELEGDEQEVMLREFGIDEPALHGLVREIYNLLGLHSFFTAGPTEVRAWTIRRGATASEAAYAIHSDIQEHFIRAEVYTLDDLRRYESEVAMSDAGVIRVKGEDYVVEEGDIIFFRHDA